MNRRTLLKAGGLALCGVGFAGGGSALAQAAVLMPAGSRRVLTLAPVRVSWDRVIRTTVGLRPHRDSGFVLRAEKQGKQLLVHNYGHGGAGVSLAWGTGAMAADMALAQDARRAAVIGCGAVGLAAARQLQRRGFDVTIYTATVPPDTTSNMSMAGFTPTSGLVARDRRTPAWDAQFTQAAEIAFHQLQLLAGSQYGVSWIDNFQATDDPTPQDGGEEAGLLPERLRPGRDREVLGPGEHPFPTRFAVRTPSLRIEPSIYLDALVRDFLLFGGHIVIRRFESAADVRTLAEPVVVNCTGLGARALFSDDELVPVKGQLTFLTPQEEITYRAGRGSGRPPGAPADGSGVGMTPRSDGIVLGNTQERGNWSLDVNEEVRQRVVANAMQFFGAMTNPGAAS